VAPVRGRIHVRLHTEMRLLPQVAGV
jgi:hypothetical protein